MLIWCSNKGCGKNSEATLDKGDNEVYCAECDQIITGISSFTKATLKSLGQTKKATKEAYGIKCQKCNNEQLPKVNAKNELVCKKCDGVLSVGKMFDPLVRKAIKEKESK